MEERINILIGSDINYAPYYGVMLTSLFMNNRESKFDVYLLTDETWTEEETARFNSLCKQFSSSFQVYKVNAADFRDYPKTGAIALSTYYRLEASRILPSCIHKILYLDGDMIVTGNIDDLWNTDLSNKGIAWVLDSEFYTDEFYNRLKLNRAECSYCNAGVALFNLDFWRYNNVRGQAIKYIEENMSSLRWMDQDVINVILEKHKIILPLRYNIQTSLFLKKNWNIYSDDFKKCIELENKRPIIIHYSSQPKPWNFRYFGSPYYREWEHYRALSNWKKCLIKQPIIKYIKYLVKRFITPSFLKGQIAQKWHIEESNKQVFWT